MEDNVLYYYKTNKGLIIYTCNRELAVARAESYGTYDVWESRTKSLSIN